MTFGQIIFASTIALAALGVTGAHATPITYNVDLSVGAGSITGTITTDGALGTISAHSDFTSFNLTVNDGSNTGVISSPTTVVNSNNTGLTASLTDLTFDFDHFDGFQFIDATTGTEVSFYNNDSTPAGIQIFDLDGDGQTDFQAETGTQIIATAAVPEPATWTMMLAGLLSFAGFAMYRRRKQSRTNLAA